MVFVIIFGLSNKCHSITFDKMYNPEQVNFFPQITKMNFTMKKGLFFILFCFSALLVSAQVTVSGACFDASATLVETPNPGSTKATFTGTGTVFGGSSVSITIVWASSVWQLQISGQAMIFSTLDSTLPPDMATGNWSIANVACTSDPSAFSITGPSTLPVELAAFDASAKDRSVELSWLTLSETNNRGFEVQRSLDGTNWLALGFVEGKGSTTQAARYNYVDASPRNGALYYRLKQIDFDGQFEYSDVVLVHFRTAEKSIAILGNPIKDGMLQLSFDFDAIDLRIVNQLGKTIIEYNGFSDKTLDVSSLGRGVYYLNVRVENEMKTIKFLKL